MKSSQPNEWEEKIKFDRRVLERNLQKGLLKEKELKVYLKNLPNLEDEYEEVSIEELLPPSVRKKLFGEQELKKNEKDESED